MEKKKLNLFKNQFIIIIFIECYESILKRDKQVSIQVYS